MSTNAENKWRRTGQQQQPRQNNGLKGDAKQQQSGSRERSHTPNRNSVSGSAWATQDKNKPGSGVATPRQGAGHQQNNSISATPAAMTEDQHVPIRGFNSTETKAFLKQSYKTVVSKSGGDEQALLWRPKNTSAAPKAAWGTRLGAMHNGRDFWVVLRNQISQLEQQARAGG